MAILMKKRKIFSTKMNEKGISNMEKVMHRWAFSLDRQDKVNLMLAFYSILMDRFPNVDLIT